MPFYEYECSKCGFHHEALQAISDAPLKKCPNCGKSALRKLISAPVFRLKGSGWYETDFKSDKENKRNLAGAEKEEAKSESKTEADKAKPDAKADGAKADAKADAKSESKSESKSEGTGKPAAKTSRAAKRAKPKAAPKRKARR